MEMNRKTFLRTSLGACALTASRNVLGANDRIRLALIGTGRRGPVVASAAAKAGAEIAVLCDLDERMIGSCATEIAKVQSAAPARVKEYRRVLDNKDIDGVIIATPDHWHARLAMQACQAGKDAFVEKPLCQTIQEGQLIREAARKHKRILQVGTQRRSTEHFRSAVDYVASGKLGKVCQVKAWIYEMRPSIGRPADCHPPSGVDYDTWLGPAPARSFNPNRFHYNWRFFWDYGNTELGNQGIHVLDVGMWAIQKMRGMEHCLPKRITATGGIYWLNDAKEVPDTQIVAYEYDDLLLSFELRAFARDHIYHQGKLAPGDPGSAEFFTAFYGTEGTLLVDMSGWKVYTKDRGIGPEVAASGGSHEKNFLDCMRSRALPNSDVEIGRLSTMLCHLGNIAYRAGHPVNFDAKTETFPGDEQANRLLVKQYRKPYELPKV